MNPPTYETADKYLGSFLLCQDAVLTGCTRVSQRRVVFRFIADAKLHGSLQLYWNQVPTALVPLEMRSAMRRLKRLARGCRSGETMGTAVATTGAGPQASVPPPASAC